jgi:hypothetical protein
MASLASHSVVANAAPAPARRASRLAAPPRRAGAFARRAPNLVAAATPDGAGPDAGPDGGEPDGERPAAAVGAARADGERPAAGGARAAAVAARTKGRAWRLKRELDVFLRLVVEYPAARGSAAVLLGYFLHVNPVASLHWDAGDALLGLQLALPIAALDALIMLPEWEPATEEKEIEMRVPAALAARMAAQERAGGGTAPLRALVVKAPPGALPSASAPSTSSSSTSTSTSASKDAPDEEMVTVKRTVRVRKSAPAAAEALFKAQSERAMGNVGRALSPPLEAALLLLVHSAEEMLYRGLLLTAAATWATDRLYEAGAEDVLLMLPGGGELATAAAGGALAAAALAAAAAALAAQRELLPLRALAAAAAAAAAEKGPGGAPAGGARAEKAAKMLALVRGALAKKQRWGVGIKAANEVVQWACLSASFLLTGNLLAPLAGSVAADALYSLEQRGRLRRLEKAQAASMREFLASERGRRELLRATRAERTARLAPPAPGARGGAAAGSEEEKKEEVGAAGGSEGGSE